MILRPCYILILLVTCVVDCAAQEFPKRVTGPANSPGNLIQLSPKLYSGSEPNSQESFEALRSLGIQTIVSVDGLQPDIKQASSVGMQYVHIPIGYGTLKRTEQLQLARVKDCPGPIFVHCHHGKHRGPTAALIVWLFSNHQVVTQSKASPKDLKFANQLLTLAGTDTKYKGLWAAAGQWKAVGRQEKLPPIFEVTKVSSLAKSMSMIDHAIDRIGKPQTTDLNLEKAAATETVEGFRESLRWISSVNNSDSTAPELAKQLKAALKTSQQLELAIESEDPGMTRKILKQLIQQCNDCHATHR